MRAVVMQELGSVTLSDVDPPEIEDAADAIVAVRKSAICGSDLHVLDGRIPGMQPGDVLGHEFTGIVEAVGSAVGSITVGDRVVGSFLVPCGACGNCARDAYNHCEDMRVLGYGMLFGQLRGAQAERVRVPNADLALLAIPDHLDDEEVLFAGDILTTAYYANRLGEVGPGKVVAVQGCGPVGILTVQVAKALGCERVVAIDLVDDRLELAASYGAETINAARSNPGVAIDEFSDGGAEVVLDTAGGPSSVLAQTFDVVRAGGTIAVVGVYSDFEMTIPLNLLFMRNITLRFGGTCPVPALWRDVVGLVADGRLDPTGIISHRLPLEDALEGYDLFASRQATKVVLDVAEGLPPPAGGE